MKWFTISIHADGHRPGKVYTKEKPLTSFWDDKLHIDNSFAVLGFHVYTFGGQAIPMCLFDVCKFDVTRRGSYGFDPVSPMISPKFRLRDFVLDGKIYVFSCHQDYLLDANIQATLQWDEVFDVDNGKWKALLDPPHDDLSFTVISAALENPNMILVAFPVLNESLDVITFYTYNVQDQSWKMIALAERKLHRKCPRGSLQKTVTVHNTLYWATVIAEEAFLLAYNLDSDTWLEVSLKGVGISCDAGPFLFHLEKQRFCLLQFVSGFLESDGRLPTNSNLHCVGIDVSPMPGEKRLGILLAWEQIYKLDCPFAFSDCLLLPEIE